MRGRFGPAIADADLDQDILRSVLGVLDEHVEVAIVVEDAGIQQFIFRILTAALPIGPDQVVVWKCRLRILVQVFHVRVGRRIVQVEVILLDIFAVVALAIGEAEQALFQNGIFAVPERKGKTEQLLVVAESGQTVLAPVISSRTSMIVGEVIPGISVRTIVFANGTPLPLAQIRSPFFPGKLVSRASPAGWLPDLDSLRGRTPIFGDEGYSCSGAINIRCAMLGTGVDAHLDFITARGGWNERRKKALIAACRHHCQ